MGKKIKNSVYQKVYNLWVSKNDEKDIDAPLLCYSTAGNVWESFNTLEDYFGRRNHFLFEESSEEEYLIERSGNYFVVKYDTVKKTRFLSFIKIIAIEEILNLVRDSEINETKDYEAMGSITEIFDDLISGKFSYYCGND